MKTSLTLIEYEDILDSMDIYSLLGNFEQSENPLFKISKFFLALSSYVSGFFEVCSRAFMKLESLTNLSTDEQEIYSKLAKEIFLK